MNKKRMLLFRIGALLLLILIAALMFVIGRGHTVYIDNKTLEYEGKTYESPYKVEVTVKGERVAKLYEKERGSSSWMGIKPFKMSLEITEKKGGESTFCDLEAKLPFNMDGVVLNIPALLAGLPEEAYLSEFVPAVPEPSEEDEEIVIDEFGEAGEILTE